MKLFLLNIGSFLAKLSAYLVTFGSAGLFVLCLLDSTFVPLPSSADALLLRNISIFGIGGVIVPFVGIKIIDLLVAPMIGGL